MEVRLLILISKRRLFGAIKGERRGGRPTHWNSHPTPSASVARPSLIPLLVSNFAFGFP